MFNRSVILIVDDEPVVRALLCVALEPAGARIVEAADGSEALETAWRERPDVVMLDVGLPKLSGIDVCRALKTNPAPPHVILITGDALLDEIDACGADRIIAKPFRPSEVLAAVQDAMTAAAAA
jgi:two-component system OmpR family response regulator